MAAYHDELVAQAVELAEKDDPSQADLRRSVSAAYYAVFHLLIGDAARHWNHESSRAAFARIFEHSAMRRASNRVLDSKIPVPPALKIVAKAFLLLQDERYVADYHNGEIWTVTEALEDIDIAKRAFESWAEVRHETAAQEYLISFLIRPRD